MTNTHAPAEISAETNKIWKLDDLDGVLIEFSEALESGNVTIGEWIEKYPSLGRDFVRLAGQQFIGVSAIADDPAQVERLQRIALTTLGNFKTAYLGEPALQTLVDKARGITAAKIAATTQLTVPMVAKLNQRLFTLTSIPGQLIERLAEAVGRSTDEISEFLAGPPTLARGAAYRSDESPVVGKQEDFQNALRADNAIPESVRQLYLRE